MNIKIVIAVNKKDVWFCRICIASIRYYYPEVEIFLLKDELNGKFSTEEIEVNWKVQLISYDVKKFGWSAAKMHFYCDERFEGQRFLVLDSDIVLVGKLLDESFVNDLAWDVVVSEEVVEDPSAEWFGQTYFDYNTVKTYDFHFKYQGYAFNCGQLFCKGNFLSARQLEPYFDFNSYPPWKRLDIFPLVDQSLFNYLLPSLAIQNKIKLSRENFMLWSENKQTLEMEFLPSSKGSPFLIHWAGALRTPFINRMSRSDILTFFEKYYYSKVNFGDIKRRIRLIKPLFNSGLRYIKKRVQH
ncbi:MAG: hypothetical protein EOO46_03005 [Flavobacterium sp.]|nr:MAG: hypothetical protein EOO46_03005 [Flavobacterium sp.]